MRYRTFHDSWRAQDHDRRALSSAAMTAIRPVGSGVFQSELQRMLVLAGEIHHLIDLRLGHFIAEDPADADAALVNVEHDACRLLHVHAEKALENEHDEF